MNTNREKTSNVMGITVSILLHAIFLAGCLALDASNISGNTGEQTITQELPQEHVSADQGKTKS
jgi:PBP1b-binding outer membrane lipoprotein LpoB